jgi:uncharacterized protein
MSKIKVDAYIDADVYYKLLAYKNQNKCKTDSAAINAALNEAFATRDEQVLAVERLTKVIQGMQARIDNAEYDKRMRNAKAVKEI